MFTVKINDICVPGRGVKTEGVERWKWKIFLYLDLVNSPWKLQS